MNKIQLLTEAKAKLNAYIKSGIAGLFIQGWDRLNAADLDVDLRREPSIANAIALLHTADNRLYHLLAE